MVTLDAFHTQKKTAKYIVEEKQPTLRADIAELNMDKGTTL